jgi:hypothetical protein
MSWARYALIAMQDKKDEILNKLKDYENKKLLSERDGKLLFVYEGRVDVQVDKDKILSLSVDDEDDYCVEGNLDMASTFNARIEMVTGYSVRLSDKKKLEKHAEGKTLLKEMADLGNPEEEEEDDFYNCRFDVLPDKKSDDLMERLNKLAEICEELEVEHRVSVFDDGYCEVLGDLEDVGIWIGPSAYVKADWDEHLLIINSSETLFDDNNLDFRD